MLAGDGLWLALGALGWLVRYLRKTHEVEPVVEELKLGESILVTNIGPAPRRREARRAAAKGSSDS